MGTRDTWELELTTHPSISSTVSPQCYVQCHDKCQEHSYAGSCNREGFAKEIEFPFSNRVCLENVIALVKMSRWSQPEEARR